jgi:hypothetical protein
MAQQQMFNSLAALVGPAEMDRFFSEYRSRLASEAAAAALHPRPPLPQQPQQPHP